MTTKIHIRNTDVMKKDIDLIVGMFPDMSPKHKKDFAKAFLQEVFKQGKFIAKSVEENISHIDYVRSDVFLEDAQGIAEWIHSRQKVEPGYSDMLPLVSYDDALKTQDIEYSSRGKLPTDDLATKVTNLKDGWNKLKDGIRVHVENGKLHRVGGPAVQCLDGTQEWWEDGLRHNENGPAVIAADGTTMYFYDNELHNDNGPAVQRYDGTCEWYVHGNFYKEEWRKNGLLHREGDDPAVKYADGTMEWWNENLLDRKNGEPAVVTADGNLFYYEDGVQHRNGGPAVEKSDGTIVFMEDGVYHRNEEEGPSVIHPDGGMTYFKDGKRHREDDKPAMLTANGDKYWYNNGKLDRDGGPAIEFADGSKHWYRNGIRHRDDGPASISSNGEKQYFLHGKNVSEDYFTALNGDNVRSMAS